ncbi:MAG: VOC family protein [Acidobacteriota bacterium]
MAGGTATQVYLMTPDKIKVRIKEDKSLTTPIAADRIKMMVADRRRSASLVRKTFRRRDIVTRNGERGGDIPGSNILFEKTAGPMTPTRGRAFDRIGLEVVNLEAFCKKLEDAGIKFENPYRKAGNMNAAFAVFQDPYGTLIELSEGLSTK